MLPGLTNGEISSRPTRPPPPVAESLVHRHRNEGRHEKKSHRKADCPKDERELPKVAEALIDLTHRRLRRDRRHARQFSLDAMEHAVHIDTIASAHHEERHAVAPRAAAGTGRAAIHSRRGNGVNEPAVGAAIAPEDRFPPFCVV